MSGAALSGRRSITLYEVRRGGKCIQGEQEEEGGGDFSSLESIFPFSNPILFKMGGLLIPVGRSSIKRSLKEI